MKCRLLFSLCVACGSLVSSSSGQETESIVKEAMKKAATFYVEKVARHGGYVYYTAPDFSWRHGEGRASDSQIWVQPPGTPTVGMAFLAAHEATEDPFYLKAATDAGNALIYGQLESGGWTNWVDFLPEKAGRYRNGGGNAKGKNFSSLDDGISQAAIRFMILLDQRHDFTHEPIHESASVALENLLAVQFENGAFPQGWDEIPAKDSGDPAKRGNFPDYDWRTEGRIKEYWDQYTLNDDLALDLSETLITAHEVYGGTDYLEALKRLGDFLILAQMPEPQPGWAQQYNREMQPIWARKFEPPAISGRETETSIATLMRIATFTKDSKYLKPIPNALQWLKRSVLSDGRLARYYELETNEPLYMERKGGVYSLTYDDSKLPSHYGWKNKARIETLQRAFESIMGREPVLFPILESDTPKPGIKEILADLNEDGAWISTFGGELLSGQPKFEPGERYIHSGVFSENMSLLSRYLHSAK